LMRDPRSQKPDEELKFLLEFLERTREGKYAVIEKTSLPYSRMTEETDFIESIDGDFYYYGVS